MEAEQFYAKTKDNNLFKVMVENDMYPDSPRELSEPLGTMFIQGFRDETKSKSNGGITPDVYGFIKERLEASGHEDEVADIEEKADFSVPGGVDAATQKLYDVWKKDLCAAVPIYHYNHGGDTIRAATSLASGLIYVGWDNPEVKEMLKDKPREEVQKWAEGILRGEIKDYDHYLVGEVYKVTVEGFDKSKMQWNDPDTMYDVLPDDNVPYNQQTLKMVENALLGANVESGSYNIVSEEEAQKITTTPSEEYKQAIGKQFITEIKDNLQRFDGNVDHAQKAVALVYQKSGNKILRDALSAYLMENGCTSQKKTLDFMTKQLSSKEQSRKQAKSKDVEWER